MTSSPTPKNHKDLKGFHRLPRHSLASHARKGAQPRAPRAEPEKPVRRAPLLNAFRGHWGMWLTDYLRNRFGRPHPFQVYRDGDSDNGVYMMPGGSQEVVLGLAGDWATGTDEAEKVAHLIQADRPDYTIHLGDVYYVGDRTEVQENFLGVDQLQTDFAPCAWPRGSRGSFALLGNHEMYSRAQSYYNDMLPSLGICVNGRAQGQRASFFCLENEYWRLVALDTGYTSQGLPLIEYVLPGDCHLHPELIRWLRDTVRISPNDRRGVVLFSHHQYYSRFEDWFPKPALQLAEFIERPVLWFWGHEHRLAIYRAFSVPGAFTALGRCIGHGGMPVDLPPRQIRFPQCEVEFVDDRAYPNDERLDIGFNGYARLRLCGPKLAVDYVDVEGSVVFQENWASDSGVLRKLSPT